METAPHWTRCWRWGCSSRAHPRHHHGLLQIMLSEWLSDEWFYRVFVLCHIMLSTLLSVPRFCPAAPQTSWHAGGEESYRASARRHFCPRPHPESPQLCPLGAHEDIWAHVVKCWVTKELKEVMLSDPASIFFVCVCVEFFYFPLLSCSVITVDLDV